MQEKIDETIAPSIKTEPEQSIQKPNSWWNFLANYSWNDIFTQAGIVACTAICAYIGANIRKNEQNPFIKNALAGAGGFIGFFASKTAISQMKFDEDRALSIQVSIQKNITDYLSELLSDYKDDPFTKKVNELQILIGNRCAQLMSIKLPLSSEENWVKKKEWLNKASLFALNLSLELGITQEKDHIAIINKANEFWSADDNKLIDALKNLEPIAQEIPQFDTYVVLPGPNFGAS